MDVHMTQSFALIVALTEREPSDVPVALQEGGEVTANCPTLMTERTTNLLVVRVERERLRVSVPLTLPGILSKAEARNLEKRPYRILQAIVKGRVKFTASHLLVNLATGSTMVFLKRHLQRGPYSQRLPPEAGKALAILNGRLIYQRPGILDLYSPRPFPEPGGIRRLILAKGEPTDSECRDRMEK